MNYEDNTMDHVDHFLDVASKIATNISSQEIAIIVELLVDVKEMGGRVFVLGVGGSAGNASHMVNDLRKLCGVEAYAPTDNVSEYSARVNDDGADTVFVEYLKTSKLTSRDCVFVLSVGGGSIERNISVCLIKAIEYARSKDSTCLSIVGKKDGYAALNTTSIVIPELDTNLVTPLSEAFQAIIWHCIVSDPSLQCRKTTW